MTRASELLQYGQFTVGSAEFAVGASSTQGGRASRSNRLGNYFGLCGGQHAKVKFRCAVEFEIENRHRHILLLGNRKSTLIDRASVAIPAVDQYLSVATPQLQIGVKEASRCPGFKRETVSFARDKTDLEPVGITRLLQTAVG